MAAPTLKERQVCWSARDLYWRCLDDNAEDAARCKQLRSSFEASCPQQWGTQTPQDGCGRQRIMFGSCSQLLSGGLNEVQCERKGKHHAPPCPSSPCQCQSTPAGLRTMLLPPSRRNKASRSSAS